MDFKSFIKQYKAKQSNTPDQEDIRKTAEKYRDKSDSELLGEIVSMAKKGKEDGSLSDEQLRNFVDRISPMLGTEERERLLQAIEMIRNN